MLTSLCPCGTGSRYVDCCSPRHRWTAAAQTPEALMRARYSAYALGELDYVFRTWHPRTRPDRIESDPRLSWTGLSVIAADDHAGEVSFVATFECDGVTGELREQSRFEVRRGCWVYVDGVVG